MDFGLKNRPALVLGGGSGLGRAIAISLGREGASVVVAGRHAETLEETKKAVEAVGGKAHAIVWDLADLASIDGHVSEIEQVFGPVQILVNNTGGPPPTPVSGQDIALWQKNFEMMVLSVIAITDRVLPGMKAAKWGRIITSTSSGVVAPIPNLGLSNALRMTLVGWSKTLAREVGRDGITANIVLPGRVATSRIQFLDEQKAKREGRPVEEVTKESTGAIPAGRYGRPEEYGDTVAFLASQQASYINGSTIRVDGGFIASV
ncbi:SDR family oxidoreductase [Acetobacteraceae bacterium H6797]|nr:SDR family oxidoreductase [Acetobacteraceae bacterium H6797]